MLKLVKRAIAQTKEKMKIEKKFMQFLKEGKSVAEALPLKRVEENVVLNLSKKWWLEEWFNKFSMSFFKGTIIFAFIVPELMRIILIILLLFYYKSQTYATTFFAGLCGDFLLIVFPLVLINAVHKSLMKVKDAINEYSLESMFRPPISKICVKKLSVAKLDEEYVCRFFRPVVLKTAQYGFDLVFNKNYCLGTGFIVGCLTAVIIILFPYRYWGPPEFYPLEFLHRIIYIPYIWFIMGMTAWILFLSFLIVIHAGRYILDFIPQKPLKNYYNPLIRLALLNCFALATLVTIGSPYLFLWSIIPPDPIARAEAIRSMCLMLIIWIPTLIILFSKQLWAIHWGMRTSKERKLLLIESKLKNIKEKITENPDKYIAEYYIVEKDYEAVLKNSDCPVDYQTCLQVIGTLIIPVIGYLILFL